MNSKASLCDTILKPVWGSLTMHISHKYPEDLSCAWISKNVCTNTNLAFDSVFHRLWEDPSSSSRSACVAKAMLIHSVAWFRSQTMQAQHHFCLQLGSQNVGGSIELFLDDLRVARVGCSGPVSLEWKWASAV